MSLTKAVYGALGVLAVTLSVLALVKPALALPPEAVSPLTVHLVREQAALGLFLGLMLLWCLNHLDQRRAVHTALVVFAAVFAAIHWWEYAEGRRHLMSPLANSIPLIALLAVTPFRESRLPSASLR